MQAQARLAAQAKAAEEGHDMFGAIRSETDEGGDFQRTEAPKIHSLANLAAARAACRLAAAARRSQAQQMTGRKRTDHVVIR